MVLGNPGARTIHKRQVARQSGGRAGGCGHERRFGVEVRVRTVAACLGGGGSEVRTVETRCTGGHHEMPVQTRKPNNPETRKPEPTNHVIRFGERARGRGEGGVRP